MVLHFDDALQLLRDAGLAPEGGDDLSGADELRLGELVKEKHGVDFFVVDRYPSSIRPFYTMLDPSDSTRSNSYDFFLRGQEICSGAQRVHDPSLLRDQLRARAASLSLSDAIDARVRVRAPTHASRRRREGFGPRRGGPLGLAEELHAGLRARRAAARGLRVWLGARRLPLFGAGQH